MLAYIEGVILEITDNSCVVLTNTGVGYEIFLPVYTLLSARIGEKISLFTAFVVREDAQELFGFSSWDERQTFSLLRGINRVGARTAMSILSTFRPDDLRAIAKSEDPIALTQVPGIGKKVAQQVFIELKYKMKKDKFPSEIKNSYSSPVFLDVISALKNFGFDESVSSPVVKELLTETPDLDVMEAMRAALRKLGKGK